MVIAAQESGVTDPAVPSSDPAPQLDRRAFLVAAGALALAACSDDVSSDDAVASSTSDPSDAATSDPGGSAGSTDDTSESPVDELPALTADQFAGLAVCAVLPSTTAGPFPSLEQLDRRDVTEGYPGHPLRLGVRVVDDACNPVPGAEVEIWHTDATGDYSSFEDGGSGKDEGAGTTFCRGFQTADADGILEFQTIYPGWYGGRAVHIHVRARVDGDTVLTSQIYFDEAYTEDVFATGAYAEFGSPDTTWATDGIAGAPATDGSGVTVVAGPTHNGDGTLGLLNLGVSV